MTTGLATPSAKRPRAAIARQVADVLRRQVLHGAYPTGLLPDESSLGREFGVSRNAARQALDLLRTEGLVERVPGTGTLVVAAKLPHGLNRLMGLAETLIGHGVVTNEVRTASVIRAPAVIAARLRIRPDSRVVYVERLRRLDGLALSLDLTYLAADVGEPLLDQDLENNDIFGLIERVSGQPLDTAELTIEAVNADPHSAAVLEAPRGAALLMIERLSHLRDGRPVDLEFIRFRGDRLSMRGQARRADADPAVSG